MFQSIFIAAMLAAGAVISEPRIVKAMLVLLAVVVLMSGSLPRRDQ